MNLAYKLEALHLWARKKVWLGRFAIFCRIVLAAGFLPSGWVKIIDERFAAGLDVLHPMGHYLEALHFTGYYYTFIGVMQILAAILLLIPRTVVLGLFIYFPIILNIAILSHSVRFDGSLFTSPLMCLACLYLFIWYYHRWKFLLPFYSNSDFPELPVKEERSKKIPFAIFAGVFFTMVAVLFGSQMIYSVMPRNTPKECIRDCADNENPEACLQFCECAFSGNTPFDDCLEIYSDSL